MFVIPKSEALIFSRSQFSTISQIPKVQLIKKCLRSSKASLELFISQLQIMNLINK